MAVSRKNEERFLDSDERQLLDKTRGAQLSGLSDQDLIGTLRMLRERQLRARAIANRQRREMRGKSEPRSSAPATRNDGTERKNEILTGAIKRINNERNRRAAASAQPSQTSLARKAFRLKKAADGRSATPSYKTANEGMRDVPNTKYEDLSRRMEIGRVVKTVATAQAKRDARQDDLN